MGAIFWKNTKGMFKNNNTKIIFMGTPEFSVPCLDALIANGYNISAVITKPDKPKGRGQKLFASAIKIKAIENSLTLWQPEKISDSFINKIKKINPDVIIVVAYGKIIPKKLLEIPKFGCINLHPSLLAKYRGSSPIQSAILNGDKITGNTLMLLDEKMDHGPILSQSQIVIDNSDTYEILLNKLADQGAKLLISILPKYLQNKIKPVKQDHRRATYTAKITKQQAEIDWKRNAEEILNKIKAFNPIPTAFTMVDENLPTRFSFQKKEGKKIPLKIYSAKVTNLKLNPGEYHINKEKFTFIIGTDTDAISILELQLPGKKRVGIKSFINGLK